MDFWFNPAFILRSWCIFDYDRDRQQAGEWVFLVWRTLRHYSNINCAVVMSYMALAEDEETGRSEKDSSLEEHTATRKNAVTHECWGQNGMLFNLEVIVHTACLLCTAVFGKCGCHIYMYFTCAGLRPSAPRQWWAPPHSEQFSWLTPYLFSLAPVWWCAGPAPHAPEPAESPTLPVNTNNISTFNLILKKST